MALVVFFRGINVGGHRAFRPSLLAGDLRIYDAVNVGAAGTLVVRKPGPRARFLAELRRKLPFEATIAYCEGSDLVRLEMDNPFGTESLSADVVRFVSILSAPGRAMRYHPDVAEFEELAEEADRAALKACDGAAKAECFCLSHSWRLLAERLVAERTGGEIPFYWLH